MIDGFKLTFSDNTVFRASENVTVAHTTTPLYLLDGFNNLVSIFNEYIDSGGKDNTELSNYAGVFLGFGAGVHTIQLTFQQYEGSSDTWGSASSGDSALKKMQIFNHALTNKQADSKQPAQLEVGVYESSGLYDPIDVAVGDTNLEMNPNERASDFSGTVEFLESVDSNEAIDALQRPDR